MVITEDWFALSHFQPLLHELRNVAREVVVVTRSSGRLKELQELGVRTRALDLQRGSFNLFGLSKVIRALSKVIDEERPDAVHAIALQPMALVSLALNVTRHLPRTVFLHLTGRGYLAVSRSFRSRALSWVIMRTMKHSRGASRVWVLAENGDDIDYLHDNGIGRRDRSTLVPGAGVEPQVVAPLERTRGGIPVAVFVGRMVRSKGVHTLVEAYQSVATESLRLALYGAADPNNPDAIANDTLAQWRTVPGLTWHGHVKDISAIGRNGFAVVAASLAV